jgi:hypothetical protein
MRHMNRPLSKLTENRATLSLHLDALLDAVDDVRSAALVVSNMARYKDDRDLSELAKDLFGIHSTMHRLFIDVLRELRQCLANDDKHQGGAEPLH